MSAEARLNLRGVDSAAQENAPGEPFTFNPSLERRNVPRRRSAESELSEPPGSCLIRAGFSAGLSGEIVCIRSALFLNPDLSSLFPAESSAESVFLHQVIWNRSAFPLFYGSSPRLFSVSVGATF